MSYPQSWQVASPQRPLQTSPATRMAAKKKRRNRSLSSTESNFNFNADELKMAQLAGSAPVSYRVMLKKHKLRKKDAYKQTHELDILGTSMGAWKRVRLKRLVGGQIEHFLRDFKENFEWEVKDAVRAALLSTETIYEERTFDIAK